MLTGGRAERCTRPCAQPNDSRKMLCWGFVMQSSQPEVLVRRGGTGAYVGPPTEGRRRGTNHHPRPWPLARRPAQPIFHHKRQTWTAIASCDTRPLLRRLLILN